MEVLTITKENFKTEVTDSKKPVLLDFWATWCPPCRMQSPIVDEIARERSDIAVGKVNVDEQPELAAAFEVENIPTLVIMRNGSEKTRLVGLHDKERILSNF
ncbi:MAG: thioredoxin [Lachnospiraceae bacterium]|nr:thioredoxin [Ruminococcus sp.]MCM1274832.1 thioredoxin [Lachnospiraceae bacterium]